MDKKDSPHVGSDVKPIIVAIDGPAGSGKTTTAREAARQLGFVYLDTGAMYRAVTLYLLQNQVPLTEEAVENHLAHIEVDLQFLENEQRIYLNQDDVSVQVREPQVTSRVSEVSAIPCVREKMVDLQRQVAGQHIKQGRGVVVDGRDIGTVVFPRAEVKIYMIADPRKRADRRWKEMQSRGNAGTLEEVYQAILKRDHFDQSRSHSPLKKAADALELDTSDLDPHQQVSYVVDIIMERQPQ